MDLEQSLETQRVTLLRLLAGWIAVLGVLSFGPVALPVPRWVRAFFDRLLIRAELATQFLVRAVALSQATDALVAPAPFLRARGQQAVDVPSAQTLLRRMNALRNVLENLSRSARRSLAVQNRIGEAINFAAPSRLAPMRDRVGTVGVEWTRPRIERPPDKGGIRFGWFCANSPCVAGGRRQRLCGYGSRSRASSDSIIGMPSRIGNASFA